MELELLDKKIRRLVCKLKKHNIDLQVFDESQIEYGTLLGQGGEGVVQQCVVQYQGMPVQAAIKTLLKVNDDTVSITLDEIEMLCLARDPIINTTLNVYGVAALPDSSNPEMGHLAIVTEAGIMNALQLYQCNTIPMHVTLDIWARIAMATQAMHNRHILHQDLKPDNILITDIIRDSNGDIEKVYLRVIDLGMGKRVFTERVITDDIVGTQGYHPPEVLLEEGHDFKADIFMLGISFSIMLLKSRFLKHNLQSMLKKLHYAKQKGLSGTKLFETILQHAIQEHMEIPTRIKHMLCAMLEHQSQRCISLLEVVDICYKEAKQRKMELSHQPPSLSPGDDCHDSGFNSSVGGSHVGSSHVGGSHVGGSHVGGSHVGASHTSKKRRCVSSSSYMCSNSTPTSMSTGTSRYQSLSVSTPMRTGISSLSANRRRLLSLSSNGSSGRRRRGSISSTTSCSSIVTRSTNSMIDGGGRTLRKRKCLSTNHMSYTPGSSRM